MGRPDDREKRDAELDAKIKRILNETQYSRYHELGLQLEGPRALSRKSVADKLGLSEEKDLNRRVKAVLLFLAEGEGG